MRRRIIPRKACLLLGVELNCEAAIKLVGVVEIQGMVPESLVFGIMEFRKCRLFLEFFLEVKRFTKLVMSLYNL